MAEQIYFRQTPPGRGAVASIAVLGEKQVVEACLDQYFHPLAGIKFSSLPRKQIVYGRWAHETGLGEDLVVCPLHHDKGIEIQCHGGEAAISEIVRALDKSGFVRASESQIAETLATSLWSFELYSALTRAPTERTAKILLRQYNRSAELLTSLTDSISQLSKSRGKESAKKNSLDTIQKAIDVSNFGKHLTSPWKVVLCGHPNVGKSSLINSIVGFERTIVSATAGTTRDIVSQATAIDGWPMEFLDTAGLRESLNPVEAEGIQRAHIQIDQADLVILVSDASSELPPPVLFENPKGEPLRVTNKCDLVTADSHSVDTTRTSATTQEGIENLLSRICQRLVPEIPDDDTILLINDRQLGAFKEVQSMIDAGDYPLATNTLQNEIGRFQG